MNKQHFYDFKKQWMSALNLRVATIVIFAVVQFGITACNTEPRKDNTIPNDKSYSNYPPELISFIREDCQLYNSAERKSETYVEVDQLAYYDNIQILKKQILKDSCLFLAVIKTDAYGNGIEHLAKVAEYAGVDYLGITENSEILKLRSLAIKLPILRLRLASLKELSTVHTNIQSFGEVEEMVGNLSMCRNISKIAEEQNRIINVHLSLNSGRMSRDGFDMRYPGIKDSIIPIFKLKNIRIRGIMTHFANSDTDSLENLRNLVAEFKTDAEWIIKTGELKRKDILLHAAASAMAVRVPESQFDMVRPGTITYGVRTVKEAPEGLKPVMSLYSSIGQIMSYSKGNVVGYGSIHQLDKDSYLANLPIGWGNGLPRNTKYALIHGQRVKIVGRLSMNATMLDITPIYDQVKKGDQVVFFGKQGNEEITIDEICDSTGAGLNLIIQCDVGKINSAAKYPRKLIDK